MKTSTFVPVLGAQAVAANYMCPAPLGMTDVDSIVFGYKVQALLESYYNSVDVNATFFGGLPMADQEAMNGETVAANMVTNVMGLSKQAMLGGKALKMAGMEAMKADGGEAMMPKECDYNMPMPSDGMAHLKNAYFLEATMCGAFIGLADYVRSPEASFLMARLAAEHGIHASGIRANMQAVGFDPESEMLTPAFTPEHIMMTGDDREVGKLGGWLNGCAMQAPEAPCGGTVEIGSLLADLTGQSGDGHMDCNNGNADKGDDKGNQDNMNGNNGNNNNGGGGKDMDNDNDNDMDNDNDNDNDNNDSPPPPAVTGAASQLKGAGLSIAGAVAGAVYLL